MSEKTFKIVGDDISDGYHTFGDLYEHRCLLFICWMLSDGRPEVCYFVREHFAGWDLIVCDLSATQISYHVPEKYRPLYEGHIPELPAERHNFDGHTSGDVALRLLKHAGLTSLNLCDLGDSK